ncbi:hypothetical protein P4O66_006000 [Electrophorus voltai]|uniref:Tetratricopeptide repeat domain 28 n=1 Tax=Electrophorus voltai TaxID=2609070 RepID=A0AAD8ZK05_9TELE|nr:hypothetical protein P4O66_006000 [Electrophorus voltai]
MPQNVCHLGDVHWLTLVSCRPLPGQFSLFGPRALGRAARAAGAGPGLTKAEFMEKVRQSNEACQLGDFHAAVRLYGEALRADPQNCILYSNRSAAHLKLGHYQTALDDAVKARLLNPKWPKFDKRCHKAVHERLPFSASSEFFSVTACGLVKGMQFAAVYSIPAYCPAVVWYWS